jgi:guanine deaminase
MTKQRKILHGGRVLRHAMAALEDADILIEGERVAAIEPWGRLAHQDAEIIDAQNRLVIPGLVNAHTHGHGNLSKGVGDRWTLELLLNAGSWTARYPSSEVKYLAALIGAVEMLLKGCTACYDLFVEFPAPSRDGLEAVGRAYSEAGMRAVVAPMMADRTFFAAIPGLMDALPDDLRDGVRQISMAPGEQHLEICSAALKAWPFDRDRIRPALAPTIPLHCADDFMVGAQRLAHEYGIGYHTHLGESKIQAFSAFERYGTTLTRHLAKIGVLGANFTAAHAVWLDAGDISLIADHGGAVAHNPGSNMRLGSGIAPIRQMLSAGVRIGVGTDAASCSDNLNMFEAMRLASLASNVRGPDYEQWLTTAEVLRAATEGSAGLLGFEGSLGRIDVGYFADIVCLDAEHVNYMPLNNIVNQLVHTEDGTAVEKVLVGGRVVVEDGEIRTVDRRALKRQAEAAAERLRGSTAAMRALAERLEPIVGTFCRGIAGRSFPIHRYGALPASDA